MAALDFVLESCSTHLRHHHSFFCLPYFSYGIPSRLRNSHLYSCFSGEVKLTLVNSKVQKRRHLHFLGVGNDFLLRDFRSVRRFKFKKVQAVWPPSYQGYQTAAAVSASSSVTPFCWKQLSEVMKKWAGLSANIPFVTSPSHPVRKQIKSCLHLLLLLPLFRNDVTIMYVFFSHHFLAGTELRMKLQGRKMFVTAPFFIWWEIPPRWKETFF